MIDLHMHLLPGIDDGPDTMEQSLEMLRKAKSEGIEAIVATSHCGFAPGPRLKKTLEILREAAAREGLALPLYLGCEVACSPGRMEDILQALSTSEYPTLNGTRYVLTEFSPFAVPMGARKCLEQLLAAGYIPVIAHAERSLYLAEAEGFYREMRRLGCRIQCNVYSFAQESKPEIRAAARQLLTEELVDVLGTDAHRPKHRPPQAAIGLSWLLAHTREDYFRAITEENARSFLGIA